jgi:hypothetical protein
VVGILTAITALIAVIFRSVTAFIVAILKTVTAIILFIPLMVVRIISLPFQNRDPPSPLGISIHFISLIVDVPESGVLDGQIVYRREEEIRPPTYSTFDSSRNVQTAARK